jgi:hypothetical protein
MKGIIRGLPAAARGKTGHEDLFRLIVCKKKLPNYIPSLHMLKQNSETNFGKNS